VIVIVAPPFIWLGEAAMPESVGIAAEAFAKKIALANKKAIKKTDFFSTL
jgi:hypothetical protein